MVAVGSHRSVSLWSRPRALTSPGAILRVIPGLQPAAPEVALPAGPLGGAWWAGPGLPPAQTGASALPSGHKGLGMRDTPAPCASGRLTFPDRGGSRSQTWRLKPAGQAIPAQPWAPGDPSGWLQPLLSSGLHLRVEKGLDRPLNSTGHGHLPFLPLRKSFPQSTPLPHTETLMCALTDTHSLALRPLPQRS